MDTTRHTGGPLRRSRHGKFGTRVYQQWADMIRRCENPNTRNFPRYGGRGIRVCPEWRADFVVFYRDMGEPGDGMQLDRIDNDGNYEPGNCRWSTPSENTRNRRCAHMITALGRTQNLVAWAQESGISRVAIAGRLRAGWPPDEAVTRPSSLANRAIRSKTPE